MGRKNPTPILLMASRGITSSTSEVGDVRLVVGEDLIGGLVQTFAEVEPVG